MCIKVCQTHKDLSECGQDQRQEKTKCDMSQSSREAKVYE